MALTWLQRHYLLRLETKLSLVNSSRFFAHIQRLPIAYFVQRYAGEIGSRLAINDRIAHVIASNLTTTAINVCVLVFYLFLLLWYDVWLTLVVMTVAALNVLTVKLVARARADAARRLLQDRGKLQGHGDGWPGDDRDAQGHRRRGRVLRALGRLSDQVPGRRAGVVPDLADHRRRAGAGERAHHARGVPVWRAARHERGHDRGHAGRLSHPRRPASSDRSAASWSSAGCCRSCTATSAGSTMSFAIRRMPVTLARRRRPPPAIACRNSVAGWSCAT